MEEINKKAYQLLDLLEEVRFIEKTKVEKEMVGIPMAIKLDNVKAMKRIREDGYGNIASIYADVDGKTVGFSEKNYIQLRDLASEILQFGTISRFADIEFIERQIFEWLILIYREGKSAQDLLNHIHNEIENDAKDYVFYFKILACEIENSFEVGRVKISYLSREKLENEQAKFLELGKSREEFDGLFEKFKDRVLGICHVKAVQSKASKIARHEIGLALDVIKCILLEESMAGHYQLPDVDFRIKENGFANFLTETTSDGFDFTESMSRNSGVPVSIDAEKLELFNRRGFKVFCDFIENKGTSIAYGVGTDSIRLLSDAASTWNLHDRIVKIISLFESVLIPEGSFKSKGQSLMKNNLIPAFFTSMDERQSHNELVNKMYKIRDKYLHNGLELPIDLKELSKFQTLALRFVIKLAVLTKKVATLEEIQQEFRIQ